MKQIKLFLRFGLSWVVGWFMYMFLMIVTVYDGILSMICQPFMAAFFSGIFVLLALALGGVFRYAPLREFWHSSWFPAIAIFAIGVYLFFGTSDVLTVYSGYLSMLFSVANMPILVKDQAKASSVRSVLNKSE